MIKKFSEFCYNDKTETITNFSGFNQKRNENYKCKIYYMKESGKYYTSSEFTTNAYFYDAVNQIIEMGKEGTFIGLNGEANYFDVILIHDIDKDGDGLPHLIKKERFK